MTISVEMGRLRDDADALLKKYQADRPDHTFFMHDHGFGFEESYPYDSVDFRDRPIIKTRRIHHYFLGPFLAYLEDHQEVYRQYLKSGVFPSPKKIQEQLAFQRRKLLVDLLVLLESFTPLDVKPDDNLVLFQISCRLDEDNSRPFRGSSLLLKQTSYFFLVDAVIEAILKGDPHFLSADAHKRMLKAKELMRERFHKAQRREDPEFLDVQHFGGLTYSVDQHSLDGSVRQFTTGYMPVIDWYLAHKDELLTRYHHRANVFEEEPEVESEIANGRSFFARLLRVFQR